MGRTFPNTIGKDRLGKCQHPQNRQADQNTAKRHFLDGLAQVRSIECSGLKPREYASSSGGLQEVCEQSWQQTTSVHASLRHVVYCEVVICSKIEE